MSYTQVSYIQDRLSEKTTKPWLNPTRNILLSTKVDIIPISWVVNWANPSPLAPPSPYPTSQPVGMVTDVQDMIGED